MTTYIPHTQNDLHQMLEATGAGKVEDLFSEIPPDLRLGRPIDLPPGLSEAELLKKISDLANQNTSLSETICFLGGGAYDHFIPAAIKHLVLRGDFFTAYTPYQPEVSQGTLQTIYEYQSLICALTGMDCSNASLYEGATALTEAAHIALLQTGRKKLITFETVHPQYREVTHSILRNLGAKFVEIPVEDGMGDMTRFSEELDDSVAAVIMQYPNFLGAIGDVENVCSMAKKVNALSIISTYPIALGMLTPPGHFGADIVCGEGQSLGIPLSYGGPYLGFIATREALLRKLPGRITGKTLDRDGKTGYVLTLQAREQHIRREKAASNICSNQALMALTATVYMSLLGKDGMKDVAEQCFQKAHYLKKELSKLPGVTIPFSGPFFNEFVIEVPGARKVLRKLLDKGIFGGLALEDWYPKLKDHILIAVTEKRTREEMDLYKNILAGLLPSGGNMPVPIKNQDESPAEEI